MHKGLSHIYEKYINRVWISFRHFISFYQISHPFQQTHLFEIRAGVSQPLKSVCQVVVSAEVEAIRHQHIVKHGQESLVLLRLEEESQQTCSCQENSWQCTLKSIRNFICIFLLVLDIYVRGCIDTFFNIITLNPVCDDIKYQYDTSCLLPHLSVAFGWQCHLVFYWLLMLGLNITL